MTDTILNIHTDFFSQQAPTVYHTIDEELQLAMDRFLRENGSRKDFENGEVWFDDVVEIQFCDKDGHVEEWDIQHVDMPTYIGNRNEIYGSNCRDTIAGSGWEDKTEKIFDWVSWGYSQYPDATDATISVMARYDDGSEYGATMDYASFVVDFKRKTYKIVRFHFPNIDINEAEFIKGGFTRDEAIAHCRREDSHEMWTYFDAWTEE